MVFAFVDEIFLMILKNAGNEKNFIKTLAREILDHSIDHCLSLNLLNAFLKGSELKVPESQEIVRKLLLCFFYVFNILIFLGWNLH